MYDLKQRVSYVRGLAEGMGIKEDTNEGKLFIHIVDVLDEIADAIAELETSQSELNEYVETLDEDLADIEDEIYGRDGDEADYDSEEPRYIEVECPHCREAVFFDDEIFEDEEDIICPNCNETIYSEDKNDTEDRSE
jgi:formylmethanofuran dehydrogenase subunit E